MDAALMDTTKDMTTNEQDIVEGEEKYDPLVSFTPDMDEALSSAYSSVAEGKKKARMSYTYLLYMHKGKDLREKIPCGLEPLQAEV